MDIHLLHCFFLSLRRLPPFSLFSLSYLTLNFHHQTTCLSKMFVFRPKDLPPDAVFPADLKRLG